MNWHKHRERKITTKINRKHRKEQKEDRGTKKREEKKRARTGVSWYIGSLPKKEVLKKTEPRVKEIAKKY